MKKFDLNDVGVVIQGPTDHYERVLENIDEDLSYVWSTWGDEPVNNIKSMWTKQKGLIKLAFEKMLKEDSLCSYLNYKPGIHEVHDFVTFSGYEYALDFWGYRQVGPNFNSPESQLCYSMMDKHGWTFEEMIDKMSFINVDLVEGSLDIHCIKYDCDMYENSNRAMYGNEAFPKK